MSKLSDKEWIGLINNIIILTETGMRLGESYMKSLSKINIDLYKIASFDIGNMDLLEKAVKILQPRLVTLAETAKRLALFFDEDPQATDPEVLSLLKEESSKLVLAEFIKQLQTIEKLNEENLGSVVKNVQTVTNIKGKNLWMPLRYAITLEAQGPDLKLIVDLFGREKCMRLALNAYEL